MSIKTLDEYLKQATTHTTTKQQTTKQKYMVVGYYREIEFQETPMGKIPKQWEITKLKEIFDFQRGFPYRKKDISEAPTPIRFITINDIEKEGGRKKDTNPVYLKEELKIDNRFLLKKEDLLIANTDMSKGFIIGAPLYIDDTLIKQGKNLVYSMDLTKLIPKRMINTKFFFYLLNWNSIRKIMKSFAQGTNVLHINHNLVRNLNVAIPPLEEQWGIAEVLSTIDKAVEETERLIERLERLKQVLMQKLLTKGIGHKEFQETPIGKIPKTWEVVRLSEISKIIMGQSPSSTTYNTNRDGMPFLQGKAEFGRIYPKPKMHTTKPIKIAEEGDLLISVRAPVGDVNIAPYRMCIGRGLSAIRLNNKDTYTLFYFYYFRFIKPRLESLGKGSTFKAITKKDLEALLVPKPPVDEQKMIAETLYSVEKWIIMEDKRKKMFERSKRGLMELLLTGKVRVKVERVG